MKIRTLCAAGLAAGVTLTAGCVALYTNPGQCETVMRERLAETSLGAMSVTHTSVAYRGSRVVVEGELPRPASAAVAASAADATVEGDEPDAAVSAAASSASAVRDRAAKASGTGVASGVARAASAASTASAPEAASAPASGFKAWFARLKHKPGKPIAAECTFNESGLTSFRWLAPPELAKTTAEED